MSSCAAWRGWRGSRRCCAGDGRGPFRRARAPRVPAEAGVPSQRARAGGWGCQRRVQGGGSIRRARAPGAAEPAFQSSGPCRGGFADVVAGWRSFRGLSPRVPAEPHSRQRAVRGVGSNYVLGRDGGVIPPVRAAVPAEAGVPSSGLPGPFKLRVQRRAVHSPPRAPRVPLTSVQASGPCRGVGFQMTLLAADGGVHFVALARPRVRLKPAFSQRASRVGFQLALRQGMAGVHSARSRAGGAADRLQSQRACRGGIPG